MSADLYYVYRPRDNFCKTVHNHIKTDVTSNYGS